MRESIVLGYKQREDLFFSLANERNFYFADSEEKAYLHHLEHSDVDSYLLDTSLGNEKTLAAVIDRIQYLNSMVHVILFVKEDWDYPSLSKRSGVLVLSDPQKIQDCLKELPLNKRKYNRIEWPVEVRFRSMEKHRSKGSGNLLSISSGGCFVRTDLEFLKGDILELIILFKDFNFQAQGEIVRVQNTGDTEHRGLALQFQDVSPQTCQCIQAIIDEKILNSIMGRMTSSSMEG